MKHNVAISFELAMSERSRASEKPRRPTAVDDSMWRFQERRAKDLGIDLDELVEGLVSRSTHWRVRTSGATPQLLQKVEERLAHIEATRGIKGGRGALMKQWADIGADLLTLDDESVHFKQALAGAREVLAAARQLEEARAVFRKK